MVAGELGGAEGPIRGVATAPVYYDLSLDAAAHYMLDLPHGHNVFVYVYEGGAEIGPEGASERVERGEIALLEPGPRLEVRAAPSAPMRAIVVGGRPLGEPIARYGPFVMNTQEEIFQAIEDYQAGRL